MEELEQMAKKEGGAVKIEPDPYTEGKKIIKVDIPGKRDTGTSSGSAYSNRGKTSYPSSASTSGLGTFYSTGGNVISAKPSVTKPAVTPQTTSLKENSTKALTEKLVDGVPDNEHPLYVAIDNNQIETALCLLQQPSILPHAVPIQKQSAALHQLITLAKIHGEEKYLQLFEQLLKHIEGHSKDNLIIINEVQQTSLSRHTPLLHAIDKKLFGITALLLKYGANPVVTDYKDNNALHCAVKKNNLALVKLILEKMAPLFITKVNAFDESPLYVAVYTEQKDIVELFLEYNLDLNTKNEFHQTVLHTAADIGFDGGVELLLEYGADPTQVDDQQKTPADLAEEHEYNKLATRLREAATNYKAPKKFDSIAPQPLKKETVLPSGTVPVPHSTPSSYATISSHCSSSFFSEPPEQAPSTASSTSVSTNYDVKKDNRPPPSVTNIYVDSIMINSNSTTIFLSDPNEPQEKTDSRSLSARPAMRK